jgi:hypothetical protein
MPAAGRDGDERCVCRRQKKTTQMLKQVGTTRNRVQHDRMIWFSSFCHPEPGPELVSGSIDFGISVLGLEFGF